MSSRERWVLQPSRRSASDGSATVMAASPGLRSTIVWGIGCPQALAEGVHHLQHRDALAAAEVEGEQLGRFRQQAVEGRLVPSARSITWM